MKNKIQKGRNGGGEVNYGVEKIINIKIKTKEDLSLG